MAVEIVVRHWMPLTAEEESAAHEGLGMVVGWYMGVFYTDDGIIRSRDTEWLQGDIKVIIKLFRRV